MTTRKLASAAAVRRGRRGESAQAMVEFGIVASFFILLVLGIVNFGIAYQRQMVLATAASNGARYASSHSFYHSNGNTNTYNAGTSSFAKQSNCGGSSYSSCPSQTIAGVIQQTAPASSSNVTIPDTDTNIIIRYCKLSPASPTYGCGSASSGPSVCGTYSTVSASWTYAAGYSAYSGSTSATSCGGPGDVVDIKVTLTSAFALPIFSDLFSNGITQASEQQTLIVQ